MVRRIAASKGRLLDERGASAVEFALLVPVYLLLVIGALAYGIYFGAAHSVQQLTADAARTAVAGLSSAERQGLVEAFVARNGGSYVLLAPENILVEAGPHPLDGNQYRVVLRYDATHLPIWNLYLPLPLPQKQIVRTASIRRGGI